MNNSAASEIPGADDWLVKLSGAGFRLGGVEILEPIDWTLARGRHWAVLGPNGAGKSTFLRLVRGDISPSGCRESRIYRHKNGEHSDPLGFLESTSIISPELWETYRHNRWSMSGLEAVCTGFFNTPLLYQQPNADQWARAQEAMSRLEIGHLGHRQLMELSRGQVQKIMLARALVSEPAVLFLDECCAGLDPDSRQVVLKALQSAAENGTQLVMATHHKDELPPAVSHALVLEAGKMVRQGPLGQVLEKTWDKALAKPLQTLAGILGNAAEPGSRLFEIRNAQVVRFFKNVLHDLNWTVKAGENWAVLGANGSGKTTLMGLLLGDFLPSIGGAVSRFDDNPQNIWDIRKRVGYLSAEFQAGHEYDQTALETVASGFFGSIGLVTQETTEGHHQAARRWLEFFGMSGYEQRDIHTLSYGQLRKVLLARALVHDPQVLLLDEPVGVLDPDSRREVLGFLEKLARAGMSLVFVTHRPNHLIPSITHVAVLEQGRLVFKGSKSEYDQRLNA